MRHPAPSPVRRHKDVEPTINRVRIGVVAGVYVMVLFGGQDSRSYFSMALVVVSVAAAYAVLMTRPSVAFSRQWSSAVDHILAVGIIATTGAGRSPAIGILFCVVASTALRFSPYVARIMASVASVSLIIVVVFLPRPDLDMALRVEIALGWSVGLLFAAILSALLGSLELRERRDLSAAQEWAALMSEVDKARRRTLNMVSHDLTPPIAAIQGIGRTLSDPSACLTDEERTEILGVLLEHTTHLFEFADSISDLANAGNFTKLQKPKPESVDLGHFLRNICRLEALGPKREVRLEIVGSLPVLEVDAQKLRRVLVNLLENALRHSPADQAVTVSAKESRDGVVLTVTDFGPGVDESAIHSMFTANWQGSANPGDLGLGLWIVAEFTKELGGSVQARNMPKGGLEVRVEVPRVLSG